VRLSPACNAIERFPAPTRIDGRVELRKESAMVRTTRMVGLIGGMSWESSAEYYRILNQGVRDRLGPTASARCLLWSFDFSEIEALQHKGDWAGLTVLMVDAARRLEAGGADVLLICTNTMHRMAPAVQAAVGVPLIHIADPTAERIKAAGFGTVGLLGTAFTMEQDFYRGRLSGGHGLRVLVPGNEDRSLVHRIIYEELVAGEITARSREVYRGVIARLVEAGAEAVILGCTEIMLLVRPEDSPVPIFDTTALHAEAAVEFALSEN
jgi:aspartate racemase